MKEFTYTIKDPLGFHARPTGLFVKECKNFESAITFHKGDKSVDARRLIALMGLGVKCGDTVKITAEGPDEDKAAAALEAFFQNNF